MVEGLLRGQPGIGRNIPVRDEELHPLISVAFADARRDEIAQPLEPLGVEIRRCAEEAEASALLGQAERGHQRVEEMLDDARELDPPAVARRVGIEADARRGTERPLPERGEGRRIPAVELPVEQPRHLERDHPAQEARLHELPAAVPLAGDERRDDRRDRRLGRHVRPDGDGRVGGAVAVDLPLEHQHAAALRRDHRLVAAVAGIGPGGAEARDRAVDQGGVGRTERLVVGAEAIGDAGSVAREHDVGPGGEFGQLRARRHLVEIEDDAALAPQPHRGRGLSTRRIAARALDFDDVGAVVGEHHRGDPAGLPARQVDDAKAVEERHVSPLTPLRCES